MSDEPRKKDPRGRKTLYKPEYDDLVIEWGAEGKSMAWMCAELSISKQTIFDWRKANPSFDEAMHIARLKSQQWWEDIGQANMNTMGFQCSVWGKSMSSRFPDDWRENKGVELTGANGGPVEVAAIDATKLSTEALAEIMAAKDAANPK